MQTNLVFNYLNDYEEIVAESRLIQLIVDFNRADGKDTIKLEDGTWLDDLKDGRYIDRLTGAFYANSYVYYYEQPLFSHCFVKISY